MKIDKEFWRVFAGAVWEWVIIPVLFFILLPAGKEFYYIFPSNILRFLIGILFFLPAFYITISSCVHLHKKGEGTIMPQNPPKKLVCEGIYCYTRNPMYLGYSFLYASFSFFFKNIYFLFLSIGIIFFIFIYAKTYEEKILFKRFGEEYLIYKKKTPFLIPFSKKIFRKNFLSFLFIFSDILFFFLLFYIFHTCFVLITNFYRK